MRKILVLIIALTMGGCTTINRAIQWGAAANDTALQSAEDVQCKVASVRSVSEHYNTPEKRKAYNALCGNILWVQQ